MRDDAGDRESWLLVKEADRYAGADRERDPHRVRSARSGRTLRQIVADEDGDPK
jgi:bifunctional non-homologous end joining protein LigD